VDLQASLPADPATQQPLPQSVNVNCHLLSGLFDLRHPVSFQTQLFSDKCLDEHLASAPFVVVVSNSRKHTG
jgi:hypothetical protein